MTTRVPNSSSSVIPLDPLKALSATWRERSAKLTAANGSLQGDCAWQLSQCAYELDALLAVSSQRTEDKDDTRVD